MRVGVGTEKTPNPCRHAHAHTGKINTILFFYFEGLGQREWKDGEERALLLHSF